MGLRSTHPTMSLWILCTGAHSCWNRKVPKLSPQSWKHNIVPMTWYAETLRFPFTWRKGNLEKQLQIIIHPPPIFTVGTMKSGKFSWYPPNLDSPIRLPSRETCFVTPLQSPVAACFTPLHPTLGIVVGDERRACKRNISNPLYTHTHTHFWQYCFFKCQIQ